ncbi:MAG: zinc ABC transporter substrate-binding protein [Pseudomonadota bacterium]|nr:zinc ABC transporter substrate-binding protein [Pseudomonadota bacterium]
MNILSSLKHKVRKEFNLGLSRVQYLCKERFISTALTATTSLFTLFLSQQSYALSITVSIPPLAGMVAPLLSDDDQLNVVLKPGASPHGFQLKPSHLRDLNESDLVLWIASPVDSWMQKPLKNLRVTELNLKGLAGIEELPVRQGGLWEKKNQSATSSKTEHNHEHSTLSESPRMDGHLWMSFKNSRLLIEAVSKQLQLLKPDDAEKIRQRTQAWLKQLDKTNQQIKEQLQPVQKVPYMVLHDAFQYFEHQYSLNGIGSIQLNPSVSPSLKRVAELRAKVKSGKVSCVFKEPQFPEKRVLAVTKGLDVEVGSLDPMGIVSKKFQKETGRNFLNYDVFILQLSNQFNDCLSKANN